MEESRGGERESAGHGRVGVAASRDGGMRHSQMPVSGGGGWGGAGTGQGCPTQIPSGSKFIHGTMAGVKIYIY